MKVTTKKTKYQIVPDLKLESEIVDSILHKTITMLYFALIDIYNINYKKIKIEEKRKDNIFIYFITCSNLTISVYRNHFGDIVFSTIDESRFNWAVLEGFIKNSKDVKDRDYVFKNIGAIIYFDSIGNAVKYLALKKDYKFLGEYILV